MADHYLAFSSYQFGLSFEDWRCVFRSCPVQSLTITMNPNISARFRNNGHKIVPAGCDRSRRRQTGGSLALHPRKYVFLALTLFPERLRIDIVHGGNSSSLEAYRPLVVFLPKIGDEYFHSEYSLLLLLSFLPHPDNESKKKIRPCRSMNEPAGISFELA